MQTCCLRTTVSERMHPLLQGRSAAAAWSTCAWRRCSGLQDACATCLPAAGSACGPDRAAFGVLGARLIKVVASFGAAHETTGHRYGMARRYVLHTVSTVTLPRGRLGHAPLRDRPGISL